MGQTATASQPVLAAAVPPPQSQLPPAASSPRDYGSLAPSATQPVNLSADQLSAWSTTTRPSQRRRSPKPQGLPKRYVAIGLVAVLLLLVVASLTLH
jgi:hypothetical protein